MTFIDQAKQEWKQWNEEVKIMDGVSIYEAEKFWLSKLTAYKELIDKEVEGMKPKTIDGYVNKGEYCCPDCDQINILTDLQSKISKL